MLLSTSNRTRCNMGDGHQRCACRSGLLTNPGVAVAAGTSHSTAQSGSAGAAADGRARDRAATARTAAAAVLMASGLAGVSFLQCSQVRGIGGNQFGMAAKAGPDGCAAQLPQGPVAVAAPARMAAVAAASARQPVRLEPAARAPGKVLVARAVLTMAAALAAVNAAALPGLPPAEPE